MLSHSHAQPQRTQRSTRWDSARREAFERVSELAEFFSGSKVLSKDVKDENLKRWFSHIAGEIEKLEPKRPVSTGRKIQQLIAALEEVEQFHQARGISGGTSTQLFECVCL